MCECMCINITKENVLLLAVVLINIIQYNWLIFLYNKTCEVWYKAVLQLLFSFFVVVGCLQVIIGAFV